MRWFVIKAELRDPRTRTFQFTAQKTMHGGKQIAAGDSIFWFASENEWEGAGCAWCRDSRRTRSPQARGRASDTSREHHSQTDRACKALVWPCRTEVLQSVAGQAAANAAELHAVSAGNGQDRGDLRGGGKVPRRAFRSALSARAPWRKQEKKKAGGAKLPSAL